MKNRLVDLLFRTRAAFLRRLDPFDRALLVLRGKGHLPPLSLRRHVGPVHLFETAADQTKAWIEQFDLVKDGSTILDIGCGCGVMVPTFSELMGEKGSYIGFDVYAPAIAWCRHAYQNDPRFRFELAVFSSPYGTRSSIHIESYRFPSESSSIHLVLAKSVFTHLQEREAKHYLKEISRVLTESGKALISVFLFSRDLAGPELIQGLPFPEDLDAKIRWRLASRPEAAISFDGELFKSWIAEANLVVEHFVPVFWPANSSVFNGQDLLILGKALA